MCGCSIGFTVLVITFTASAIIEVVENHLPFIPDEADFEHSLSFADAYYFVTMTITTVGCVLGCNGCANAGRCACP